MSFVPIRATPKQLARMRSELREFNALYVEYLNLTVPKGALSQRAYELRGELMERAAVAQQALNQAGVDVVRYPPPATGGPVISGLANTIFVHETDFLPFGSMPPFYEKVLEVIRLGEGYLRSRQEKAERQRRNPLYWADRVLTVFLGIPAYIVSRVAGVPVWRIEGSPLGVVLRIVGLVVDAALVFIGGREFKWW
jgi:hypothetical protein